MGPLTFLEQASRQAVAVREKEVATVATGTIKKLVPDRGFGFITADDGKDYFFHRDGVDDFDALRGGEKVTFDIGVSPRGPRANQVRVSQ